MAAILNGFLPAKKKDQYSHLNTRWGDAAISAPIHGGWNNSGSPAPSQESPDLERDLPPTPPHHSEESDGVFIVHDGEDENRSVEGQDREDFSPNLSLPAWKRKGSHNRKLPQSTSPVLNSKAAPSRRTDTMSPLGTAEAAATLPSPDSRVSSPIARTTTTPVLSFRSRFANPNLADMLSPVAEGFAKDGPTVRPAPIMSTMEDEDESTERPSNTSSLRSNMPRRASNTAYMTAAYNSEGLGGMTMTSQPAIDEESSEFSRVQPRGIAATAHMRASSRGPRASSRGHRSTSIEPATQRSGSIEPVTRRAPSVEAVARRAPSIEPVTRRAPSTERPARRAPSIEPYPHRAPSIEPVFRRTPPMDSVAHRSTSIEPVATRGQSVGQYSHRGHSVEPYNRRAPSIEPVARRGQSVDQYSSRGHSVEPSSHRVPSIQPSRGQSVDQYSRRGHPVEPFTNRGQSLEPSYYQEQVESRPVIPTVSDLQPLRRRAPSIEPTRRRAPSVDPGARRGFSLEPAPPGRRAVESGTGRAPSLGPPSAAQRAQSREPRGRRGASVEPNPHFRFHSEVAYRTLRRDSISSNDGSLDSDSDSEDLDAKHFSPPSRIDPDFTSTHKPHRRRSIASPITSPALNSFAVPRQNNGPPQPAPLTTNFDSITSRAGITRPIITPVDKNPSSRNHSQTRTRGLYADLQDDFSMLAREVQSGVRRDASTEPPLVSLIPQLPRTVFEPPPPLLTQLPRNVLNSSQRTAPPIVGAHPPVYQAGIGTLVTHQWDLDWTGAETGNTNTAGFSSDSSQPSQTSTSTSNTNSNSNTNTASSTERSHQPVPATVTADPSIPRAILSNLTRDRHDQLRRDEREKAREKVTARLEAQRERERMLAANAQGTGETNGTGSSGARTGGGSGSNRTRNVYGSNTVTAEDSEHDLGIGKRELGFEKVLVPSDEVIWG